MLSDSPVSLHLLPACLQHLEQIIRSNEKKKKECYRCSRNLHLISRKDLAKKRKWSRSAGFGHR